MRRCFCLALRLFSISSPPLLGPPRFLSSRCLLKSACQQTHAVLRQCSSSPAWLLELRLFASHPGHTCSRLGRKDEAASKDACHAPAAPPALEPRGWLPHRGGLLHLLAGTLRDHLDNCFSALFGSAFGAEAAPSMRACCPSWVKAFHFSSTRTPQPIVILPASAQRRRFVAARLRGCLAIPGIRILALQHCSSFTSHPRMCVSS